jgi:hypothetical protein
LKLKRLIIVEITLLAIALLLVATFVEMAPFLRPSKLSYSIGLYREREYARGNVTLAPGQRSSVRFTYTSYDPAILTLDVEFLTWESPGYLVFRCNSRIFATVFASPENSQSSFIVVTFSGREWVEPPSTMFGVNEISFESALENGYGGTFSYRTSIRGSR